MYEANYPEILKACYIINAPGYFTIAFNVVKRFLAEYTLSKMFIFKADPIKWQKVLRDNISLDILPKYYGGNYEDPPGDPKCTKKIRQGGKIPESLYTITFGNGYDKTEFESTVVKKGRKFTLDFVVAEDGCALKWEFRTDGHDIRFGISYCDQEGKISPAIRLQRVASHQVAEVGVIACQAPATYTVIFDNTYSLMRNKKLFYNITVTEPLSKLDIPTLPDKPVTTNGNSYDHKTNGIDSAETPKLLTAEN